MTALWDTTLASRLNPKAEILDFIVDQATQGTPVRIAAPSVLEIAYGYELKLRAGDKRYRRLSGWLTRLLASDVLSVVPLDERAALVAGRVRTALPHPPGRRDRRSKTMAGLDVVTLNRQDFETLSATLLDLFPEAPRLEVFEPDQN